MFVLYGYAGPQARVLRWLVIDPTEEEGWRLTDDPFEATDVGDFVDAYPLLRSFPTLPTNFRLARTLFPKPLPIPGV